LTGLLRSWIARWETVLLLLLLALVLVGWASAPGFTSEFNVSTSLSEMAEKSLMALPLALIIVAREIDISIASIAGLSGVVVGMVLRGGGGLWIAIAVALLVGAACGAFNGFCVTALRLPSLIVTLGTLALFRGLCYVLIGGTPISTIPDSLIGFGNDTLFGTFIPQDFVPFLILAPLFGVLLHRKATGRRIYAMGANPETAKYSGVRSDQIRFWLFVVSGVVSAIAGVILIGRTSQASPDGALGFELDALTVVFLGGVSMFGGRGRITGVFLAVLLVAALRSYLLLRGASGYTQGTAVGVLLIASLLMTNVVRRTSQALAARRFRTARKDIAGGPMPASPR
jgi:rhamnose transport system permease protein